MFGPLTRGIYTARLAVSPEDVAAALALRLLCFRLGRGQTTASDVDEFDGKCQHVVVTDDRSGTVVCGFRLLFFPTAQTIPTSYAAQFYDLSALQNLTGPMLELGRFCLHPDHPDPDILRLAWAMLTGIVDQNGVILLFGCSSFDGSDPDRHLAALGWLSRHHLGPSDLRPRAIAAQTIDLRPLTTNTIPLLPSLLKTYLGMGGWVSDHAVIDPDLNTIHVFTGLPIASVPPHRARALRAVARSLPHAGC
ncbi:MAG: GNAT family N-acyltransferase [bacterium]